MLLQPPAAPRPGGLPSCPPARAPGPFPSSQIICNCPSSNWSGWEETETETVDCRLSGQKVCERASMSESSAPVVAAAALARRARACAAWPSGLLQGQRDSPSRLQPYEATTTIVGSRRNGQKSAARVVGERIRHLAFSRVICSRRAAPFW